MAVTVVAAVLIGSVLSASPSVADEEEGSWGGPEATSEMNEVELPSPGGNKNTSEVEASALSEALDEAQAAEEPVEVEELQTSTETVLANPDGTVTKETAQAPIRVKQDGEWVDIDPNLEAAGERLEPKANVGAVSFSGDGDGALATVAYGDRQVSLGLEGADLAAPSVEGAVATYEVEPSGPADGSTDPAAGESVQVATKNRGFVAHVLLEEAPDEAPVYVFNLRTGGLVPSLEDDVLSLAEPGGKVVAQSRPLRMWDAQVDEGGDPTNMVDVSAELTGAGEEWTLTLSPSMDFLTDPGTQYPVVVDPDIDEVNAKGDATFAGGADQDTFLGNEPRVEVGYNDAKRHRGFFAFAYNGYLGATITKANLKLYQYFAPTCTDQPVKVAPIVSGDKTQPRWNGQPVRSQDARWTVQKSFNNGGGSSCGRKYESIDVTAIVSGWSGAQVGTHVTDPDNVHENRQAFVVTAGDELATSQFKRFCSREWSSNLTFCNSASVVPVLSVTFEPEIGEQGWYSMTERQLDDRTTLKVNNKNTNLFIATEDVNVKGVGMDLTLNRTFNSQSREVGPMGAGWSLNVGPDIWLEKLSQYRYNLHAPGGTVLGTFVRGHESSGNGAYRKFVSPLGGIGAELEEEEIGSTGNYFLKLTYRKSQQKFLFKETNADGDAFMTSMKDRSDNEIEVEYTGTAGSKPKITEIIDTVGRKLTPTYTGNVITKWATEDVEDVDIREWEYSYSGGSLVSATDAMDQTTNYSYFTPTSGPKLMTSLTAPANQSGARPRTEFGYADQDPNDITNTSGRVSSVAYRYGDATNQVYRYTWELPTTVPSICNSDARNATKVKDPNGHTTTYCYTSRNTTVGNAKTWVHDARGKVRSQDYNPDNQPLNSTAPTGQGGGASAATRAGYSENVNDRLESITAPASASGSTGDTSNADYDDPKNSSKAGGTYLPDTVSDGSGNCNEYGYDDEGRTISTFTGLTGTAGGCTDKSTGRGFHVDYNDNGTVDKTWDANNDDDTDDSQKTIYTYWASGVGTPEGAQGQVKSIRKPGGDCSTGPSRRLCTSFTYDGAARVKTMIDGRGQKTRYFYDANDRITVTHFNSDTSEQCPAAGLSCIGYSYDAAGNLKKRDDLSGATEHTYDRLNRLLTQKQPAGLLGHDNLAYVYDGANNMTGYSQTLNLQPADVTTYTYNAANQPTMVTSAVGSFELTPDDDGRLSEVEFPNPNSSIGVNLKYTHTRAGKPKDFTWTGDNGGQLAKWTYSYKDGTKDTPQLRTRDLEVIGADPREGKTTYGYNSDQRLASAKRTNSTDPYSYEYTYDKVGNILSEKIGSTTTHHGYNRAGERCWTGPNSGTQLGTTCPTSPSGATTFNHDAAGNNTGTASDPVNYNEKSQVSKIGNTDQTYWGPGNDTRFTRGTERQISGQLGMTATSGDIGILYYTRSPDGTVLAVRSGSSSAFYVTEPNGHVAYMTDVNGAIIGAYEYSPYGKTTVIGNVAFNPIRYLGAYQESNNSNGDQIYKLGARFYGTSGAFTQPDAISGDIGDPRTMTAYNYAGGDPINQQDASGYFFSSVGSFFGTVNTVGSALATLDGGVSTQELLRFVAIESFTLAAEVGCNIAAAGLTSGVALAASPALCSIGAYGVGLALDAVIPEAD